MKNKTYIIHIFLCFFSLIYTYPLHSKHHHKKTEKKHKNKQNKSQISANNNYTQEGYKKALCAVEKWNSLVDLKHINSKYSKAVLINAKALISDYEFAIKEYTKRGWGNNFSVVNATIKHYRFSKPIAQVDSKIAQAFEIIKKDLQVDQSVELRVLPAGIYEGANNVVGFFERSNPGVVYIIDTYLQRHPVCIIRILVHELEHYRQFWCYPDSFAWTLKNIELLGQDEFNRQLEHGADKRAAKYFKCCKSLTYLAYCSNYEIKDPQGYFSKNDYAPYISEHRFSSCKGFSCSDNETFNILDYLPNSGIYKITSDLKTDSNNLYVYLMLQSLGLA